MVTAEVATARVAVATAMEEAMAKEEAMVVVVMEEAVTAMAVEATAIAEAMAVLEAAVARAEAAAQAARQLCTRDTKPRRPSPS